MEDSQSNHPQNSDYYGGGGSDKASWRSETTWIIASGSLENSITFDSSDDDDSPGEIDSPRKPVPLLLKPPPADSEPCEIKLYFTHKYNIRQIYVRSTARTFEIYHSQSQHGEKEYLCTARCSVAVRDDGVLQAKFSEECLKDTAIKPSVDKFDAEETNASSEDDWVDVKVLDSPLPDKGTQLVPNKINCSMEGVEQDYYEATVEISDSEPCALVTIRLLSLQSKDFVFIDEIYVFAELVDPVQSGSQAPDSTGSAGNPLMAMLFPALLQLSKSRANDIQAEEASDKMGKLHRVEMLSKASDMTSVTTQISQDVSVPDQQYMKMQDAETLKKVNNVKVLSEIPLDEQSTADHQYVKLQDLNKCTSEDAANTQLHDQNLAGDRSSDPLLARDFPNHCINEILEQLVSRVSRIEEVCLRFEENMLKPINRMEMRLQRVEEQLESFAKKSDYSELPTGTRFCAPSFSCNSNSSSVHNDGSDGQSFSKKLTLDKAESSSGDLLNTCEGVQDSVKPPHLLPSLVVTAPEFSCIEDEQDADRIEPFEGNSQDADLSEPFIDSYEITQKSCLIDDVFAAELSNFLLSSCDNPSYCKQTSSSDYCASQMDGNGMSSQNAETHNSSAHEFNASVSAHEEPPKFTQILTDTGPEFTTEQIGSENDEESDFIQLPSIEAASPASKTDRSYEVPLCLFENVLVQVNSEPSCCVENKSAFDQHVVMNDHASLTLSPVEKDLWSSATVQNQFFEGNLWLLDGSSSSLTDQAKDSASFADLCETVKEADLRDSTTSPLSPRNKDVLRQNLFESAAATEGKDFFDKLFASGFGDATFTAGNSSTQTSLETLLGHHLPPPPLQPDFTANSPKESGGIDFSADEYKFIEFEGNDFIDPQTGERLLLELGIYDTQPNVDEESSGSVGNHNTTTSNQEMRGSLI